MRHLKSGIFLLVGICFLSATAMPAAQAASNSKGEAGVYVVTENRSNSASQEPDHPDTGGGSSMDQDSGIHEDADIQQNIVKPEKTNDIDKNKNGKNEKQKNHSKKKDSVKDTSHDRDSVIQTDPKADDDTDERHKPDVPEQVSSDKQPKVRPYGADDDKKTTKHGGSDDEEAVSNSVNEQDPADSTTPGSIRKRGKTTDRKLSIYGGMLWPVTVILLSVVLGILILLAWIKGRKISFHGILTKNDWNGKVDFCGKKDLQDSYVPALAEKMKQRKICFKEYQNILMKCRERTILPSDTYMSMHITCKGRREQTHREKADERILLDRLGKIADEADRDKKIITVDVLLSGQKSGLSIPLHFELNG